MPNVIDNEDLYNVIVLNGVSSPGRVTLSGHDRKINWDVKVGPALTGATTTLHGIPPIEFSASFYLVKDVAQGLDDFEEWPHFQRLIDSTVSGKTPKALDIYHPDLAANDVKSVCKAQVGGFTYDGKGGATVVVKFQEYKPPRKQGGTPKGSTKGPDPNADVKKQLAALTAQYQATPWG
jgi:hypothetical protein